MNETFNVKDAWGDMAYVTPHPASTLRAEAVVHLDAQAGGGYFEFTPKQARRLAKALRKAAKIAKENA